VRRLGEEDLLPAPDPDTAMEMRPSERQRAAWVYIARIWTILTGGIPDGDRDPSLGLVRRVGAIEKKINIGGAVSLVLQAAGLIISIVALVRHHP